MKKLVVLSFVCALALVLSNACSAQEKAAPAKAAVPVLKTTEPAAQEFVVPEGQFAQGCPCEGQYYQPGFCGHRHPLFHHRGYGYGYVAPCGQQYAPQCGQPYAYPYANGPYGYPNYAPIRNFLSRVFAPRPYCGYDAYYGPYGDFNNGCYAPCNTPGRCW